MPLFLAVQLLLTPSAWALSEQKHGKQAARLSDSGYKEVVERINEAGQDAAAAHNRGDEDEVQNQVKIVEEAFQFATEKYPARYDAYCNYANFCLNVNRFPCAVKHFENCLDRMNTISDDDTFKQYIGHLAIYSLYGEASFERDIAYANGNGNMEETLRLMNKQLYIYPFHPGNLYDKGILLLNMAAVNNTIAEANQSLTVAQESSMEAFPDCPKNKNASMVSDWNMGSQVSIHKIDGQGIVAREAYIAEFHHVNISGDDGVIIQRDSCEIYVPGGIFTNLAINIRLKEIWTTAVPSPDYDPFKHIKKSLESTRVEVKKLPEAASIIGFGSSNFYHSLIELGSRLLLLSEFLQNATIPFIVPNSKTVTALIKILGIKNPIVIANSSLAASTRFQVEKLWYAHWPACNIVGDGCHCTPPSHILRRLQAALVPNPSLVTPNRTLYLPREKQLSMRKLRNAKKVLKLFPDAEKFYPSKVPLEKAIETFQSASKVIGVHGGALSNLLFCQPGTEVVEFGWPQVPVLGHFRHLSRTLRLNHQTIPLDPDPRGSAAERVNVNMATLAKLIPEAPTSHQVPQANDEL